MCAYDDEIADRIDYINALVDWPTNWTIAERDQMQALADDDNRQFFRNVNPQPHKEVSEYDNPQAALATR